MQMLKKDKKFAWRVREWAGFVAIPIVAADEMHDEAVSWNLVVLLKVVTS